MDDTQLELPEGCNMEDLEMFGSDQDGVIEIFTGVAADLSANITEEQTLAGKIMSTGSGRKVKTSIAKRMAPATRAGLKKWAPNTLNHLSDSLPLYQPAMAAAGALSAGRPDLMVPAAADEMDQNLFRAPSTISKAMGHTSAGDYDSATDVMMDNAKKFDDAYLGGTPVTQLVSHGTKTIAEVMAEAIPEENRYVKLPWELFQ